MTITSFINSLLSLIKKSREFCLGCVDKTQHHCSRVAYHMLADKDNEDYKMELCRDIKDGSWTAWATVATERCVGVKNVGSSNFTCGPSRTLERRICSRSLGGKHCRDQTGAKVLNDEMVRTVPCKDVKCPGHIDI